MTESLLFGYQRQVFPLKIFFSLPLFTIYCSDATNGVRAYIAVILNLCFIVLFNPVLRVWAFFP